ncbi:MAG TPA: sulfite exporter TauE/SafE family protein [Candidatus Lumbricidophila sp.]|nr:sulfite exporter TauE/SafE family protein [Candidatus Lumbricidophila sp.]
MTTLPTRDSPSAHPLRLALVGLLGGLLSGLLGVGGGSVMVPLLVLLVGLDQRRASATSLAAIVPAAIAGAIGYASNGQIDVLVALLVAAGGIVGGWLGSHLLRRLPLGWLRWLFIALLLLVAARMLLAVPERVAGGFVLTAGAIPGLVVLGLVVGIAAGIFGIGGGLIMVPVFIALFGMSDLIAKGTSLAAMIPTAISGTWANARASLVDVRSALTMGLVATVASLGGVAVAHLLSPQVAAWLFIALLVFMVVQLARRAIREHRNPARGD